MKHSRLELFVSCVDHTTMACYPHVPAVPVVDGETNHESSKKQRQRQSSTATEQLPEVPSQSSSSNSLEPAVKVLGSHRRQSALGVELLRDCFVSFLQLGLICRLGDHVASVAEKDVLLFIIACLT